MAPSMIHHGIRIAAVEGGCETGVQFDGFHWFVFSRVQVNERRLVYCSNGYQGRVLAF